MSILIIVGAALVLVVFGFVCYEIGYDRAWQRSARNVLDFYDTHRRPSGDNDG